MSDLNDQQIDSLIRGHLNDQLDQHVGAASRRFADEIARTTAQSGRKHVGPLVENPKRQPKPAPKFGSIWSIGLVGAALAATMTIVSMRHASPFKSTPARPYGGGPAASPDFKPVAFPGEANVAWNTVDHGIVQMPDGSHARKLMRTTTSKLTCSNPNTKTTYEFIQPRQETLYVGLKQY